MPQTNQPTNQRNKQTTKGEQERLTMRRKGENEKEYKKKAI